MKPVFLGFQDFVNNHEHIWKRIQWKELRIIEVGVDKRDLDSYAWS
ncbi:MAG: hypothetical protein QW254_05335 [Desulfurococcaceae archaeon]